MDARRLLTLAAAGMCLSGCAATRSPDSRTVTPTLPIASPPEIFDEPALEPALDDDPGLATAPVPAVSEPVRDRADEPAAAASSSDRQATGRTAIAAANRAASAPSRADAFVGGVQVFSWSPGRVYEVWTAPLRVTTLTLGEGETIVSKAAGDTVRWQIGDTTSGTGAAQRTHILLKPLERGLETNLVLTTNRRVYLLDLKSGAADGFNAAIAWDEPPAALPVELEPPTATPDVRADIVMPQGEIDSRYRIRPEGRRPRWMPTSVFSDGRRTFITFDADLQIDEAPALFLIAADGEAQLVNYRQQGGLFVVDRVFDRAELRLGDRRPQIVRIQRLSGERR